MVKNNKKYLVSGGAGFIGSHLVDCLLKNGHKVICVDDLSTGKLENLSHHKSLIYHKKRIQDFNDNDFDENIDGIFHLAAQSSVPLSIDNFYRSSSNNLLSSLKVLDISQKLSIPLVYASSSAIYGNMEYGDDMKNNIEIISPYALDKLTIEKYAKLYWKLYKTSSIGLRFFNVYGPRQDPSNPYSGVISIFIDRISRNKPVIINGGYQTRDFIFVSNVVRSISQSMNCLLQKQYCDVINIGTGVSITIKELLKKISKIMDVNPETILKDLPEGDPERSGGSYKKMSKVLELDINQFYKIEEGLALTIEDL